MPDADAVGAIHAPATQLPVFCGEGGGRIGVVVRATDIQRFLNVSLTAELQSKVLTLSPPFVGVSEGGCGDVSLYRRFIDAGLTDLDMGPQLAPEQLDRSVQRMQWYVDRMTHALAHDEAREFGDAINRAIADKSLIYGEPFHCATGVKP